MIRCFTFTIACLISSAALAAPNSQEAAKQIDRLLFTETVGDSAVKPQPPASDEIFLRRAYYDLTGSPPPVGKIVEFSLDPDAEKRTKLVAALLADPKYGENWARYWRDMMYYRRSEPRSGLGMQTTVEYLTSQFNENKPWDEIAASFITAQGDIRENGATAIIMAQGGKPEETVAEVSRIFMGIQIQCAQCHDHPYDEWKREQFHELAAFFPRVAVRPANQQSDDRTYIVTVTDRRPFRRQNNNNRYVGTLEHYMPDLDEPTAKGKLMSPVFFATGEKVELGSTDADRRGELADWLTGDKNRWFAVNMVNRIWSELLGEGFYPQADDLGPDRKCIAPKTLDYLANAFVANDYDVKWLMQTIMSTDAYDRASQSQRKRDAPPYLANCNQRLRSDQLFDAITSTLELDTQLNRTGRNAGPYNQRTPRNLFAQVFGYDPSEPRDEVSGSIPQTLFLMNSPLINRAIIGSPDRGLAKLLREIEDNEALVVELYLKAYSRQPTDAELKTCLRYIASVDHRQEAFEDILWALVNSTEFTHRR